MELRETEIIENCIFKIDTLKTLVDVIQYSVSNNDMSVSEVDVVLIAISDLITQYSKSISDEYDEFIKSRAKGLNNGN